MKSNVAGSSLPKNWPKGVKMAVLHVISLAHVAIVYARSTVVNSSDVRTRPAGDLQGSLDEISLLEEELRIKDARMALIDAHRRPHYRPIERMAILELKAARGWSQAETARRFLVKPTIVASWLKRIDESGPALLVPKQAYNDGRFRNGAGLRRTARTVPPAVCDGCVALGCSFVMLDSRTCWGPTRTGTSIPRHHEANSTPQRPIHLSGYGAGTA